MPATVSVWVLQTNRLYTVYLRMYLHGGGDNFELPQEGSQASRLRLISRKDEGEEEEAEVPDAGDWKT